MNLPSPNARRKARIEIIPLIDIVFFLLATFVMVSLSMVKNPGNIRVSLPDSQASEAAGRKEQPLVVFVTAGNEIFIGDQRVQPAALKKEFALRAPALRNTGMIVKSDKTASVDALVRVLDAAKQAGIKKLGVAVEPKRPS